MICRKSFSEFNVQTTYWSDKNIWVTTRNDLRAEHLSNKHAGVHQTVHCDAQNEYSMLHYIHIQHLACISVLTLFAYRQQLAQPDSPHADARNHRVHGIFG